MIESFNIVYERWKNVPRSSRGKIIAISGAQSTGKTTLIDDYLGVAPNTKAHLEVTRRIKRAGFPINTEGLVDTQACINSSHYVRFIEAMLDSLEGNDVLLDRCALDGYIYTNYLMNRYLRVSSPDFTKGMQVLREAYEALDTLKGCDEIYITYSGDVELVDDGERSIDKDFRDSIIDDFDSSLDTYAPEYNGRIYYITGNRSQRLQTLKKAFRMC